MAHFQLLVFDGILYVMMPEVYKVGAFVAVLIRYHIVFCIIIGLYGRFTIVDKTCLDAK